jgi:hypothetical protein
MITFYITTEERRRAQKRAAELDIDNSDPPGRFPHVWDNRLNSVKRWYDYGAAEEKIGTIYFRPVRDGGSGSAECVECTTEITRHPLDLERRLETEAIPAPKQHGDLVRFFLEELLFESERL